MVFQDTIIVDENIVAVIVQAKDVRVRCLDRSVEIIFHFLRKKEIVSNYEIDLEIVEEIYFTNLIVLETSNKVILLVQVAVVVVAVCKVFNIKRIGVEVTIDNKLFKLDFEEKNEKKEVDTKKKICDFIVIKEIDKIFENEIFKRVNFSILENFVKH